MATDSGSSLNLSEHSGEMEDAPMAAAAAAAVHTHVTKAIKAAVQTDKGRKKTSQSPAPRGRDRPGSRESSVKDRVIQTCRKPPSPVGRSPVGSRAPSSIPKDSDYDSAAASRWQIEAQEQAQRVQELEQKLSLKEDQLALLQLRVMDRLTGPKKLRKQEIVKST